ncbi:hypothetical protein DRO64_03535 [Candidatus Bathyarchaeota archaeon]|nr:MAG: hypothetical protein DRO64_03535 [Candidatus Bathyarchaeota archaeon]
MKDIYKMMELKKRGYSYKKISEVTGWSTSTIVKYTLQHLGIPFSLCLASAFRDCSLMINPKKVLKKMEELLQLEKDRRGLSKDELVFIGMANVANYYWCAMKSLLKSKKMELEFFGAYLKDRINYSFRLKGSSLMPDMDELPRSPDELLNIGNEINLGDIEKLLKERAKMLELMKANIVGISFVDLYAGKKLPFESRSPKRRGETLEIIKAERYPTIRWNFNWENYVVVGEPDGITDNFVYEFKSTKNRFLMNFVKPVALTQADLYGYFFKRNRKRVQIYIMENDMTETFEEKVDKFHAIETLRRFKSVDEGEKPLPPKEWKCRVCDFKGICKARSFAINVPRTH